MPLLAVLMVAIAVRLVNLASIPLWTDELFTRFYPDAGLQYLWGDGFRAEPTPPLYYSIIWLIERGFGTAAWVIRAPSVAGSLASVVLAWLLGRELFEKPGAALIGALLLGLAPTAVFYAQEARAYALQGAALSLALLGFARILRGAPGLTLYVAGAVLAMWLHPTSLAALAAMNVTAVLAAGLLGRSGFLRWIGANVLVLAACLPLVSSIVWPPDGGAATSWIPALTRWSLENVMGETLAGPALLRYAQRIAEIGVVLLAVLALLPPWRPGWRAALVLVVAPGLGLALMVGISAFKPILLARTLAWLLVPLAVALGGMLSRRPVLGIAAVALTAAGLAVQIIQAPTLKENWPGLFAQMPGLEPPALLVLAPHSPPGAVAVYAPTAGDPVRLDDGKPPVPETTVMPRLFGTATITQAEMLAAIQAGRPVWLIYRRPEYDWVQHEIAGWPAPKRAVQSEPGTNPALRALSW